MGARLQGLELMGRDLHAVRLDGAELDSARLDGADLSDSMLSMCTLRAARLNDAVLDRMTAAGMDATGAQFRQSSLNGAHLESSKLVGARLDGAQLAGAHLDHADLEAANLAGSNLRDSIMRGARLVGSDLRSADLRNADLRGADLGGADLGDSNLDGACFLGSNLDGAKLYPASARKTRFRLDEQLSKESADRLRELGAILLPTEFSYSTGKIRTLASVFSVALTCILGLWQKARSQLKSAGRIVLAHGISSLGASARFARRILGAAVRSPTEELRAGSVMHHRDLSGLYLANRDLRGADLRASRLVAADLSRTDLRDAQLEGADLSGANLSGANLEGAGLRGVNLSHALLAGARMGGADLTGARLYRTDARACVMQGVVAKETSFAEANLQDALLGDADLSRAVMDGANLRGCSFENCRPDGMSLGPQTGLAPDSLKQLLDAGAFIRSKNRVPAHRGGLLPSVFRPGSRGPDTIPTASEGAATVTRPPARRLALVLVAASAFALLTFLLVRFFQPASMSDANLEQAAEAAADEGDLQQAFDGFDSLQDRSPDTRTRVAWILESAMVLEQDGAWAEAASTLARAVALDPDDNELEIRISLEYAKALGRAGSSLDSIAVYEDLLENPAIDPEQLAECMIGLVDRYYLLGFHNRAVEAQRRAMERFPANPEVGVNLARRIAGIYISGDRPREALKILSFVPSKDLPNSERATLLLTVAQAQDLLGRYGQAMQSYEKALALLDPGDPTALSARYRVARIRVEQGDMAGASGILEQLDSPDVPPDIRARSILLLAESLRRQGEVHKARELYRRIVQEFPHQEDSVAEARMGLGSTLGTLGGNTSVEALLQELDQGGQPVMAAADILLGRAQALLDQGNHDLALDIFDRVASAFAPGDRWGRAAVSGRASALSGMGRHTEALELLKLLRAGASGTESLVLDVRMGDTLLKMGRLAEASTAFQSVSEVTQGNGEAAAYAILGLGQAAESQGDAPRAVRLYSQVVHSDQAPEVRADALEKLAGLYFETGRDEQAVQLYREFLDLLALGSPASTMARFALADIYARQGELSMEQAVLEEIIHEGSSSDAKWRARARLAEMALRRGEPDKALESYGELLMVPGLPDDIRADVAWGRASAMIQSGQAMEALGYLDVALEKPENSSQVEALRQLRQQAMVATGQISQEDLPQETKSDQAVTDIQASLAEAASFRDMGQADKAMALYQSLLDKVEDRPARASIMREMALANQDREAARNTLERIVTEYSDLPEASFMAGYSLGEMDVEENDPEAALARYSTLEPPDQGHRLWLAEARARALVAAGRWDEARAQWGRVLKDWAGDPAASAAAWMGLGQLLMQQGDTDRGIAALTRAFEVAPEGILRDRAQLLLASASMEVGDTAGARMLLSRLLADSRDREILLQARLALSGVLQEQGEWKNALQVLEQAEPGDLGLAYIVQVADARGVCLMGLGRIEPAEKLYRQLDETWGSVPEAHETAIMGLAEVSAAGGDMDEARRLYRSLVSGAQDRFRQAQALLRMAQLLEQNGRIEEARKVFQEILVSYQDEEEIAVAAEEALK